MALLSPILLILLFVAGLATADGTEARPGVVSYGNGIIDPLVEEGNLLIPAPPGARISVSGGETNYSIADHLGSVRIAATQAVEYAPYGDIVTGGHFPVSRSYVGKRYDDRVGTYDFLARQYDASSGRFLGRDAVAEAGGPYTYANADPINKLDPDGRAPVHFFMYSYFGVDQPDSSGRPSLRSDTMELLAAANESRHAIVMSPIESIDRDVLPHGIEADHLTLSMHGYFGVANLWNPVDGRQMNLGGDVFAYYLHSQMRHQYGPGSTETLRSINMAGCYNACRTRSSIGSGMREDSFADVFARSARGYFPRLERVTASPYAIGVGTVVEHDGTPFVVVNAERFSYRRGDVDYHARVIYTMNPDEFFAGHFPTQMYTTPGRAMQTINESHDRPVHTVLERQGSVVNAVTDRDQMRDIIHRYRDTFSEPVLMEIPVLPPPAGE